MTSLYAGNATAPFLQEVQDFTDTASNAAKAT